MHESISLLQPIKPYASPRSQQILGVFRIFDFESRRVVTPGQLAGFLKRISIATRMKGRNGGGEQKAEKVPPLRGRKTQACFRFRRDSRQVPVTLNIAPGFSDLIVRRSFSTTGTQPPVQMKRGPSRRREYYPPLNKPTSRYL
jgi:hypothetical protein